MAMRSLVFYPPEAGEPPLSREEHEALANLALTSACRRGMEKLVADAAASAFFGFFCLLDGVADPALARHDLWLGAVIRKPREDDEEHREMLHDELLEDVLAIPRASQCSGQAKRLTTERIRGRRRNLASRMPEPRSFRFTSGRLVMFLLAPAILLRGTFAVAQRSLRVGLVVLVLGAVTIASNLAFGALVAKMGMGLES